MRFDLLVRGGELVDPAAGRRGRFDVAVKDGLVAAVDHDIPATAAARVLDASGQVVTPGLVDLHTHAYPGVTFWAVDPDAVGARTGVTTWVDAGSAGAYTLAGLREYVAERTRVRVLAFLNIASIGLVGHNYELANLAFSDADLFARLADLHADLVVGVKVRMGTPTVGPNGVEPLRRARRAAELCELPVMVHIATAPPAVDDVVELLGAGDVLTHCLTPQDMRIADAEGRLRPAVAAARERGLRFDLGHGSGSFAFSVAEPMLAAGFRPDVVSTDIHQLSIDGPMFDLPTTMSKLMALGLTLEDVVARATAAPAALLGWEGRIGTLAPGAQADVALFELLSGTFPFYDIEWGVREGDALLVNTRTLVAGRELDRTRVPEPAPWMEHDFSAEENFFVNTEMKDELARRGHVPAAMAAAARRARRTS